MKLSSCVHRNCPCFGWFALNYAKCQWEINKRREWQSLVLSDQVLLDSPHVEGVIFSIRFTYLKMVHRITYLKVDGTQDFCFSIMSQNTMRAQAKHSRGEQLQCTAQSHHQCGSQPLSNAIPATTLGIPGLAKCKCVNWSWLKLITRFEILSADYGFVVFILGWAMYNTPHWPG